MRSSDRFKALEKELRRLKRYFLPQKFDPTGSYSDRQLSRVVAYSVLCHGEIESYFEDRVMEVVKYSISIWNKDKKVQKTLLYLFAFTEVNLEIPPRSLTANQANQQRSLQEKLEIKQKIAKVFNAFKGVVDNNHGIKEANLLSLLLPIGIDSDLLKTDYQDWLLIMESFGQQRGIYAHTSASSYQTNQPLDPKDALNNINKIVYGKDKGKKVFNAIIDLDNVINNLMN